MTIAQPDEAPANAAQEPVTESFPPGTPADMQPPATPVAPPPPFPTSFGAVPAESARLVWPVALRVSLVVGIVAGLVTVIPSIAFLVIVMVAAGAVATRIYRGRVGREVSGREGFRLGALTGVFCSVMKTGFSMLQLMVPEGRAEVMKQLDAQLAAALARNADPAAQEMVKRMADWFRTPEGFATMFMFGLLVVLILSVLLAGLGGRLGATMSSRKNPRF